MRAAVAARAAPVRQLLTDEPRKRQPLTVEDDRLRDVRQLVTLGTDAEAPVAVSAGERVARVELHLPEDLRSAAEVVRRAERAPIARDGPLDQVRDDELGGGGRRGARLGVDGPPDRRRGAGGESQFQALRPVGLRLAVVIGEAHERSAGGRDAVVARSARAGGLLPQEPRTPNHPDDRVQIRCPAVLDDDQLERLAQRLLLERGEAAPQRIRPVPRRHHDGDPGVVHSGERIVVEPRRVDTAVQPLLILGTHFFAPEVLDLISETPGFRVDGFVENLDRERTTEPLAGLPVHWIDDVVRFAPTHRAVCALGTTKRRRLIEEAAALGLGFATVMHPRARVSTRSTLGEGTIASVGVIVAVNTRIGRHVILNRGALIGHDTVVGDYVTVGPGANVAGLCTIGDGAYVAMGAVVVDRVEIGAGAVVAAGAVVTKDVPPNVQVIGVPARIVKEDVSGR